MRYNWEVINVVFADLERTLEQASARGWDVFSVMAVEGAFVVIIRQPVQT